MSNPNAISPREARWRSTKHNQEKFRRAEEEGLNYHSGPSLPVDASVLFLRVLSAHEHRLATLPPQLQPFHSENQGFLRVCVRSCLAGLSQDKRDILVLAAEIGVTGEVTCRRTFYRC
jgi:hypothetical protein